MKWQLPKQFKDWCRAAGLRPRQSWGNKRQKYRWFQLQGHGREWRVNDRYELQCGDTYAEFDRWALCDIHSVPLPANRRDFVAAVKALLLAHQALRVEVSEASETSGAAQAENAHQVHLWVRTWRCRNRRCMDGHGEIQVAHSIDIRHHWCSHCGAKCTFVRDVMTT